MSQCPLCPAIPSPGLAQAGLRECLLRERTHCDVTFSLCLVSDKIVESAMPFTSWASHLPPPHPGPGKTEDEGLSRQGPSPSSSSWHRSKQWVNKWGSTSGPSLAKLAAGLLCSAPLPPLSRCGKVNRPQGIARLSLSGNLKIISRIQPSLPSPLFPVWYHLHPLPPEPHRRLLPGLLLPPRSPHSQRELMNPNQVRARWAQSFPGYTSLLVKAKFSRWCQSPW